MTIQIDWNHAPQGATHYATNGGCLQKWHRVEDGVVFFHSPEGWKRYPHQSTGNHHLVGAIARPVLQVGSIVKSLIRQCDVTEGDEYEVVRLGDEGRIYVSDDVGDEWPLDYNEYELVRGPGYIPAVPFQVTPPMAMDDSVEALAARVKELRKQLQEAEAAFRAKVEALING